ncbi:class II fructose-bisphosphate aldolase [Candidatus Nomurabacteria bacterium]|nr:class II fructose-bisphosphate aldolase [Candidatus Nomurabacteria bacterium]
MKTLREYISEADQEKHVAIGHFNISNLEGLHGIFNAAKDLDLPVIIGTSEGERDFVGVNEAVALVKTLREKYDYPIFLNADHSYSFEKVKEAIDTGYDAVIFDGVKLSYEENVEVTKKCVDYARACGRDVLVEAELGNIGQSSKIVDEIPEGVATDEEFLTNVDQAKDFVDQTGIDLLAPAVGNMHGILKGGHNPKIDTARVKALREGAGVPLVLHGGSGISDDDFVEAIKAGMSIVHINTEIRLAYRDALKKSLQDDPDEVAPYKFLKPSVSAVEEKVKERLKLFNNL